MKKLLWNIMFLCVWVLMLYGVSTVLFKPGQGVMHQGGFAVLAAGLFGAAMMKETLLKAKAESV